MWFFRSITIAPLFYEIPLQHVAKANCPQILKKIVKSILSQNFINHHQSAFHSPITKFLSSNIKKILKIQWFLPQKFPTRRKSIIVFKFSKEKNPILPQNFLSINPPPPLISFVPRRLLHPAKSFLHAKHPRQPPHRDKRSRDNEKLAALTRPGHERSQRARQFRTVRSLRTR